MLSLIVRGQQNGIAKVTRPAVSELELLPCLRGGTQRSPLDETVEILHHAQTVVSGFQVPGNGRLVVDVGAIADSALVKLVNCHQLSILLGVLGDAHVVDLGEVATGKTTRFVAIGSFFFCSLFLAK